MSRAFALSTALLVLALWAAKPAPAQAARQSGTATDDIQVVAGPIVEKVTNKSAVVWWQTTAPVESILIYGTAPDDLRVRVQRPWATTTHEVSLNKLQPDATYYLAILQPNGSTSATTQFTTQPPDYAEQGNVRITNGPLFEQITSDSATIAWSTNVPSSSVIHYGTDEHNLTQTANAHWAPTTHRIVLRDLQPDTHYYFTIESNQELPSASTPAQTYAFRTLARGQQAVNIGSGH